MHARVAHLVDALPRSELAEFDLSGQNGQFILVQQSEKGHVSQHFRVTRHGVTYLTKELRTVGRFGHPGNPLILLPRRDAGAYTNRHAASGGRLRWRPATTQE